MVSGTGCGRRIGRAGAQSVENAVACVTLDRFSFLFSPPQPGVAHFEVTVRGNSLFLPVGSTEMACLGTHCGREAAHGGAHLKWRGTAWSGTRRAGEPRGTGIGGGLLAPPEASPTPPAPGTGGGWRAVALSGVPADAPAPPAVSRVGVPDGRKCRKTTADSSTPHEAR